MSVPTSCAATCSNGSPCRNQAKYSVPLVNSPNSSFYEIRTPYCGIHTLSEFKKEEFRLVRSPRTKDQVRTLRRERREWKKFLGHVAQENRKAGRKGKITFVTHDRGVNPESSKDAISVYFRYRNNRPGMSVYELNPFQTGPIEHNMPFLPDAVSLEVFFQAAQISSASLDKDGTYSLRCFQARVARYCGKRLKSSHFEVFRDSSTHYRFFTAKGDPVDLDVIQARALYATLYQWIVEDSAGVEILRDHRDRGYNLELMRPLSGEMPWYSSVAKDFANPDIPIAWPWILAVIVAYPDKKKPWFDHLPDLDLGLLDKDWLEKESKLEE